MVRVNSCQFKAVRMLCEVSNTMIRNKSNFLSCIFIKHLGNCFFQNSHFTNDILRIFFCRMGKAIQVTYPFKRTIVWKERLQNWFVDSSDSWQICYSDVYFVKIHMLFLKLVYYVADEWYPIYTKSIYPIEYINI